MTNRPQRAWLRLLIVALVLCLMVPLFMACNNEETPNENNQTNKPNNNQTQQPQTPSIYDVEDSLPESLNYGTTFTITYFLEQYLNDFWVDERTGGLIDNAVFDAISRTEERFGIEITTVHSGTGTEAEHVTWIKNQIGSGKTDFDVARTHDVHGANLSLEGVLLDLNDIPNLDFDKPWWPKNTIESLSFMGQLYLMSSSISYRGLSSTSAVFFNKGLMADHGYDLPYDLVLDGEWYLEDMFVTVEDFYIEGDMGIDGKSDDDIFGVVIPSQLYCWPESFGIDVVQKDPDAGELILNGHDERMYDLVEKMYNVVWDNNGGYTVTRPAAQAMFGENQAIYIPVHMGSAIDVFLNYKVDYGIVPYPKLDETQDDYYAGYTDRYFVIPNTCPDTDYVGMILESMSAEGYRQVTPAYFEVALKNRYTKDEISRQMVDIIKQSMVLDFAYVYGGNTWWTDTFRDLIAGSSPNKDYASYYQKKLPAAENRVNVVTQAFEKMLEDKQ